MYVHNSRTLKIDMMVLQWMYLDPRHMTLRRNTKTSKGRHTDHQGR